MQDTFFVDRNPDMLLRTHTSSVQVREMARTEPPMRIIMPGRVFRNEAISARAHCMFHQIEGLYIDEGVSFADLKQTLAAFAQEFFGPDTRIRLRPSYFPFTEPSQKWTSTGGWKRRSISALPRAPAGLKSWAVEWWIPMCWKPRALIHGSTQVLPLEWVWSASPCCATRLAICEPFLKVTCASCANFKVNINRARLRGKAR